MEKFVRLNPKNIKKVLEEVRQKSVESYNVFTTEETYIIDDSEEILSNVLDSLVLEDEYMIDMPPKKLQNVSNFDSDVLSRLKPYYQNYFSQIYGHGTLMEESAKSILEEGLKMESPEITASFIGLDYSNESFETIKNWPHLNCKYIVLADIQDAFIIPSLQYYDGYTAHRLMNRNRFIGYIDVEKQQFIPSPYYEKEQKYNADFPMYTKMTFSSQRNYPLIERLLSLLLIQMENNSCLDINIPNKNELVRGNIYIAILEQIRECIDIIKEKLETEGITRKEYEARKKVNMLQQQEQVNNYEEIDWLSLNDTFSDYFDEDNSEKSRK